MKTANHKARQRLDAKLLPLKPEDRFTPPSKGWIRAIRSSLGMTGVQFARRLGVSPQGVETIEKSEANGKIQLDTLRRAAAALDCKLVYALVPNSSLEQAVQSRARKRAMRDLQRVAHTMSLEAQGTGDEGLEDRIEDYIRDELSERDLWNEK